MREFQIWCLVGSVNLCGSVAALLTLWTNQSLLRIAIAYALGAAIPLSVLAIQLTSGIAEE